MRPPLCSTRLIICDSDKCHLIDGPAHPTLGITEILKTESSKSKFTYKITKVTELLMLFSNPSPAWGRSVHSWDQPGDGRHWGEGPREVQHVSQVHPRGWGRLSLTSAEVGALHSIPPPSSSATTPWFCFSHLLPSIHKTSGGLENWVPYPKKFLLIHLPFLPTSSLPLESEP